MLLTLDPPDEFTVRTGRRENLGSLDQNRVDYLLYRQAGVGAHTEVVTIAVLAMKVYVTR